MPLLLGEMCHLQKNNLKIIEPLIFYFKNVMSQFELIKKLEYLVAFQAGCLQKGDWEDFDRLEDSIKKLEVKILQKHVE